MTKSNIGLNTETIWSLRVNGVRINIEELQKQSVEESEVETSYTNDTWKSLR